MKNFDETYNELKNNNELNNVWREAKNQNKKVKRTTIIVLLIMDLIMILFLKKIDSSKFFIAYAMFLQLFMNVIVCLVVFTITKLSKKQMNFTNEYKDKVLKKIMNNFYDELEYFPNKPMPEYIYKEANYERYDIYESNDYFEALINNKYGIQVAEVLTKEIDEQYKMNNMNNFDYKYQYGNQELSQNTEIKFRGLFAKIDMGKSINSELKIMQDGKMIFEKNKVNMDSSEFEKYFDVKSSNQIITMQILTSDVMEELVEFENKTKMKFDIYINNKELYIRFHSGSLSVDISDFKNGALDEAIMKKYFYMLNFTYNLSSRLIEVINDIEI